MRTKIIVTSFDGKIKTREYNITAQEWPFHQKWEILTFLAESIIEEQAKQKEPNEK